MHTVRLTLLAADRPALVAHLQAHLGLRGPVLLLEAGGRSPAAEGWLERCLAPGERPISAAWSAQVYDGPVMQLYPSGLIELIWPVEAIQAATFLGPLREAPFEVAVVHPVYDEWFTARLGSPLFLRRAWLSPDFGPLGWATVFRGAGLDRVCARRFLEHGPWRTSWLDSETAIVEFHDLADSAADALKRAAPGHLVMTSPALGSVYMDLENHRYANDLHGIYVPEDQTHRVVVVDREPLPRELLDACVLRARSRAAAERPIRDVAYVFPKHEQALPHLTQLWLRELECRIIDNQGQERRLDLEMPPTIERPAWVTEAPSQPLRP